MAYYVPRLKKWRGHVPRVPHQIAPMHIWYHILKNYPNQNLCFKS